MLPCVCQPRDTHESDIHERRWYLRLRCPHVASELAWQALFESFLSLSPVCRGPEAVDHVKRAALLYSKSWRQAVAARSPHLCPFGRDWSLLGVMIQRAPIDRLWIVSFLDCLSHYANIATMFASNVRHEFGFPFTQPAAATDLELSAHALHCVSFHCGFPRSAAPLEEVHEHQDC